MLLARSRRSALLAPVAVLALIAGLLLAVAPPSRAATVITNATELRMAFDDPDDYGSAVQLGADIDVEAHSVELSTGESLVIDLNGHQLSAQRMRVFGGAALTITDTSSAGAPGTFTADNGESPGAAGLLLTVDGEITIAGRARVAATGGAGAAAIGAESGGLAGSLTIRDQAEVTAIAAAGAAAIGGGVEGLGGALMVQDDAVLRATATGGGAAIGAGADTDYSSSGAVTVRDQAQVFATAHGAPAIGGGNNAAGGGAMAVDIGAGSMVTAASDLNAIGAEVNYWGTLTIDGALVLAAGTSLAVGPELTVHGSGSISGGVGIDNRGAIRLPAHQVTTPVTGNDYLVRFDAGPQATVTPSTMRVLGATIAAIGADVPVPQSLVELSYFSGWTSGGQEFSWSTALTEPEVTVEAIWEPVTRITANGAMLHGASVYRTTEIEIAGEGYGPWQGSAVRVLLDGEQVAGGSTVTSEGWLDAAPIVVTVPSSADVGPHTLEVQLDGAPIGRALFTIPERFATEAPLLAVPVAPAVGDTVSASWPIWPEGSTFSYQWLRNGAVIQGATAQQYTLVSADRGKRISARLTAGYEGYGYSGEVGTTQQSQPIGSGVLPAGSVAIIGESEVGESLQVTTSGWPTGTRFSYQWLLNGSAVSKATKSSWVLPASAVLGRVGVRVTGSKPGYTAAVVLAAVDGTVERASFTVPPEPVLTPETELAVGTRVGLSGAAWPPGSTVRYQWFVGAWAVPGATRSTFTIPSSARGKQVAVRITVSKAGAFSLRQHILSAGEVQ